MEMPTKYLLPEERVLRHVPYSRLRKDENGVTVDGEGRPLGILFSALELRAADDGNLSVTWCEYFAGDPATSLTCALRITRSSLSSGAKSGVAVVRVEELASFLAARSVKVRFTHEPEADNPAHSLIRRWTTDVDLLEELATDISWEVILATPRLVSDQTECVPSARGMA